LSKKIFDGVEIYGGASLDFVDTNVNKKVSEKLYRGNTLVSNNVNFYNTNELSQVLSPTLGLILDKLQVGVKLGKNNDNKYEIKEIAGGYIIKF